MTQPNLIYRLLDESDYFDLQVFCNKCNQLGYYNNKSFNAMHVAEMKLPFGAYHIGYDTDKEIIFNVAGIHHMPELHKNAYRILYRGACLPGYTTGKMGLKSSIQLVNIAPLQMSLMSSINPAAEFYTTTNNQKLPNNGKSFYLTQIYGPRLAKRGLLKLITKNFNYRGVDQVLWKIEKDRFCEYFQNNS